MLVFLAAVAKVHVVPRHSLLLREPSRLIGCLCVAAMSLVGCEPARGEVRPWSSADHDQDPPVNTNRAAQAPAPRKSSGPGARAARVWMSTCANCHGPTGAGDGPMADTFNPPDLTSEEWLGSKTDDEMAASIKNGKGAMPANPNLEDSVIGALVARIRNRGR